MTLFCDGREVAQFAHYFREHDEFMQMLEDVWVRFQAAPGRHTFGIRNGNPQFYLLFSRLILQQSTHNHLDFSLPPWALVNEPLTGSIFAVCPDEATIRWQGGSADCVLQPGWNDFEFTLSRPGSECRRRSRQFLRRDSGGLCAGGRNSAGDGRL